MKWAWCCGPVRATFWRGLLRLFFEQLGVTGYYLPGLVVVAVLFSWHTVRQDPWKPEPKLYALMWVEATLLALVLFVFAMALFRGAAHPQSGTTEAMQSVQSVTSLSVADGPHDWKAQLILPIGAGIYEELVFRLIAIAVLHLLLVDVLALPDQYGAVGAVGLSAVAFAMYHFNAGNPFEWGKFAFYTAAGLYFAAVYVLRGFGIVAAVHAMYDIMVVLAKMSHH